MVELQIINKILSSGSMDFLKKNNVPSDYFIQYQAEMAYILEHLKSYGQVPDKLTFVGQFEEFEIVEVNEADAFLLDTLKEQYTYSKMVPYVKKIAELCQSDSLDAVRFAKSELSNLQQLLVAGAPGVDIIKTFKDTCIPEWERRRKVQGLIGISTGLPAMDKVLNGWMRGEEFVPIVGRTNEGKSYVLQFLLIKAWEAGNPVLLYSGEMSPLLLQFRQASLHGKFSSQAIMNGLSDLGGANKTFEDFHRYAENLSTNGVPFIVVTPKDLRSKFMDTQELDNLISMYAPKIVGVDQMSHMSDCRAARGDPLRTQLAHISEDLYNMSIAHKLPILAAVQAGREAVQEGKKSGGSDLAPGVEHIRDSDNIAHNATRILTIKQMGERLKIALKKNRYGKKDQEWVLRWNVDNGDIEMLDEVAPAIKEANEKLNGSELF